MIQKADFEAKEKKGFTQQDNTIEYSVIMIIKINQINDRKSTQNQRPYSNARARQLRKHMQHRRAGELVLWLPVSFIFTSEWKMEMEKWSLPGAVAEVHRTTGNLWNQSTSSLTHALHDAMRWNTDNKNNKMATINHKKKGIKLAPYKCISYFFPFKLLSSSCTISCITLLLLFFYGAFC